MDSKVQLPLNEIARLEELRGSLVVVYCSSDRGPRNMAASDLADFSWVLGWPTKLPALDLVLHTEGGLISAARDIALRLRESSERLAILVPHKARSAGTLLCLAADELVLGPSAEFSPIDPLIRSGADASSNLPKKISSEDIRCFRSMAENWFDLKSEESRMQMFTLLTQRFFPTTLGAFYRSDRYTRKIAGELLEYQLPQATEQEREAIVDRLVTGFSNHVDPINRREIIKIGLRAKAASDVEATLLIQILRGCQAYMNPPLHGASGVQRCRSLFFTRQHGLKFIARGNSPAESEDGGDQEEGPGPRSRGTWEELNLSPS